jgi:hypothetical protein
MAIGTYIFMAIKFFNNYSINNYWWLLMVILLVVIGGY